jgi:hypothetical protein
LTAIAVPLPDVDQQQKQEHQHPQRVAVGRRDALAPEDEWVANLDYEGFGKEVTALGRELLATGGEQDVHHLEKIVSWRDAAAVIGVLTMATSPMNPIAIAALSTWTYGAWLLFCVRVRASVLVY